MYILVNSYNEYLSSYGRLGAFWTIHRDEALQIPENELETYKNIFKYAKFELF